MCWKDGTELLQNHEILITQETTTESYCCWGWIYKLLNKGVTICRGLHTWLYVIRTQPKQLFLWCDLHGCSLRLQIARKVGCQRPDEEEMIACLKMSDPVGLTMAGKIDILLILGKGQNTNMSELCSTTLKCRFMCRVCTSTCCWYHHVSFKTLASKFVREIIVSDILKG